MQRKDLKIFLVIGTRPEFIKMYPIYKRLWELSLNNVTEKELIIKWISTQQHKELLDDLYKFFKIKADYEFDIQNKSLSLGELSSEIMSQATQLFIKEKPDLVLVQGDTLSASTTALAAFYQDILVAHVEAGIRTNDIYNPYPEELSRRIISQFATLNFAPSKTALHTLEAEKALLKKQSYEFYTGNTVVDALAYTCEKILLPDFNWQEFTTVKETYTNQDFDLYHYLESNPKRFIILVSAHRRENSEEVINNLCRAILRVFEKEDDGTLEFMITVHPRSSSYKAFNNLYQEAQKRGIERIRFFNSVSYPLFTYLMQRSYFIVTDSGGIQEEAPYLSKPVLIFRNVTERIEGVRDGLAKLIGTEEELVYEEMLDLLTNPDIYVSMIADGLQPYGDGLAAERIVDVCLLYLKNMLKN